MEYPEPSSRSGIPVLAPSLNAPIAQSPNHSPTVAVITTTMAISTVGIIISYFFVFTIIFFVIMITTISSSSAFSIIGRVMLHLVSGFSHILFIFLPSPVTAAPPPPDSPPHQGTGLTFGAQYSKGR